jgi:hypothetical protein
MKNVRERDWNDPKPMPSQTPTREQIAAAARQLYFESGQREGCDVENWLRAEQLLMESAARSTTGHAPEQSIEPHQPLEVRPVKPREHPFARDERGSPSREEIRRQSTQMRPGARESMRPAERRAQAR